jgi:hypothetical protein
MGKSTGSSGCVRNALRASRATKMSSLQIALGAIFRPCKGQATPEIPQWRRFHTASVDCGFLSFGLPCPKPVVRIDAEQVTLAYGFRTRPQELTKRDGVNSRVGGIAWLDSFRQ